MPNTSTSHRPFAALFAAAAACTVTACGNDLPAELRSGAETFPVRANWSATAAPVSPSTVSARLALKEFLGNRATATMTLTGAPNAFYQWRIFRGDCSVTTAAASNTAATGLLLVATIQSYPDIAAGTSGTATVTPSIALTLDSATAYSVRVRVSQAATNWNGLTPVACGNLQRSAGG